MGIITKRSSKKIRANEILIRIKRLYPDAVCSLATLDPLEQFRILAKWVESLGRRLRLMHDRGMAHGDCKAANILVSQTGLDRAEWLPTFIDLVGASSGLQIAWPKRHRDLA